MLPKGSRECEPARVMSSVICRQTTQPMQGRTPMTSHKPSTTPKAVISIVAANIQLAALTPSACAAGPDRGGNDGRREFQQHRQGGDRMGADRGGFIGLTCGPQAAERIEHAMVSLSYRVNPTGEQVQLLDALKTAALDAQKDF